MLELVKRLFIPENELIVYGVAEAHPASILNSALETLSVSFDSGSGDGPIDTDLLKQMAQDAEAEKRYWNSWKDLVRSLCVHLNLTQ